MELLKGLLSGVKRSLQKELLIGEKRSLQKELKHEVALRLLWLKAWPFEILPSVMVPMMVLAQNLVLFLSFGLEAYGLEELDGFDARFPSEPLLFPFWVFELEEGVPFRLSVMRSMIF